MIRTIIGIAILFCMAAFVQTGEATAGEAKECTRETLQVAVDSYLEALKAGDMEYSSGY